MATEDKIKKEDISVQEPMGYIIDSAKKASIEVDKLVKDLNVLLPITQKLFQGKPTSINEIALQEKALKKLNDEVDRARKIEEMATRQKTSLARLKAIELRNQKLYNDQIVKETQATEKLTRAQQRAESLYFRVTDKVSKLSNAYRELLIKQQVRGRLNEEETKQLERLKSRYEKWEGAVRKTNEMMGRHQHNVGNYRSAFNGLSFSMAQLTREAPAFANSVQTGFMALSNNIPIFIDEITKLKSSGESTGGVLRKIGASLFSLQTALSVGVTLLTIYGAEMVEFFSTLSSGNQQFKTQADVISAVNDKMAESAESMAKERAELEILLNVAKDETRSKKERLKAIEELNKINPAYQNSLTLETINTKEATKATAEYIKMIDKKAKAQAATSLLEEIYKKQIELELKGSTGIGADIKTQLSSWEGFLAGATAQFNPEAQLTLARLKMENGKKEAKALNKDAQEILKYIGDLDLPLTGLTGTNETGTTGTVGSGQKDKYKTIEELYALRKKKILEEGETVRQETRMIHELDMWRLQEKIKLEKATKGEKLTITNLEIELIELSRQAVEEKREHVRLLNEELKVQEKLRTGIISPQEVEKALNLDRERNIAQADYNVLLKELEIVNAEKAGKNTKKLEQELIELKKKRILAELEVRKIEAEGNEAKIQTLEKEAELEIAKLDASKKQIDIQKELATLSKEVMEIAKDYLTNVLEAQIKSIDEQIAMVNKSYSLLEEKAAQGNLKANESIKEQMRLEQELLAIREKKARQIAFINGLSNLGSSFGGGAGSQSLGQIFAGLQGFETGTETEIGNYVQPNLKGVGKDNIAVRVHKNERIINEDLSRKIQGHKTSDVINGYVQYHQMLANNSIGANKQIDLSKTNNLLEKISDQKQVEYQIEKVVTSSFDIIRKSQKGNSLEKRITRVRL